MTATHPVHLVGSLGLPDAETAFRTVAETLGPLAPRYPDGEPGERNYWIRWQQRTFDSHPDFVLADQRRLEGYKDDKMRPFYVIADGADRDKLRIDKLGYADEALRSWAVFERLRQEGVVPSGVRFLVALPTSAALINSFVAEQDRFAVEPVMEDAMRREVEAIAAAIPAESLAVQWDCASEPVAIDGGLPVYYDDLLDGSIERFCRHLGFVPEPVEAGFHLCYGDPGHKHIIEPPSLATCVALANGIAKGAPRSVQWIHMPVPRDRTDDDYMAPLDELSLRPETDLFIGLVHHTDGADGTRKRMKTAGRHVKQYGIATECGFGRRDPGTIPELLRIHAEVAQD